MYVCILETKEQKNQKKQKKEKLKICMCAVFLLGNNKNYLHTQVHITHTSI